MLFIPQWISRISQVYTFGSLCLEFRAFYLGLFPIREENRGGKVQSYYSLRLEVVKRAHAGIIALVEISIFKCSSRHLLLLSSKLKFN